MEDAAKIKAESETEICKTKKKLEKEIRDITKSAKKGRKKAEDDSLTRSIKECERLGATRASSA